MRFTQARSNSLTFQQAAMQRQMKLASLPQQTAAQHVQMQRQQARTRANQEKLAWRRAHAVARREEILAKREQTRQQNLARRAAERSPQATVTEFVALRSE